MTHQRDAIILQLQIPNTQGSVIYLIKNIKIAILRKLNELEENTEIQLSE